MKLQLVTGTAIPALVTDGAALAYNRKTIGEGFKSADLLGGVVLLYKATVTAGQVATMSFLALWGWSPVAADWFPIGGPRTATDTDRGKLNVHSGALVALGEMASGQDKIVYADLINGLSGFSRVYLQEGTSGGSGYASTAYLVSLGSEG
jgi:hypothetical protein